MSIATYLTALDRDRDALAANLTTKGVPASSSETFTTLVPKVLDIPSGGSGGIEWNTFTETFVTVPPNSTHQTIAAIGTGVKKLNVENMTLQAANQANSEYWFIDLPKLEEVTFEDCIFGGNNIYCSHGITISNSSDYGSNRLNKINIKNCILGITSGGASPLLFSLFGTKNPLVDIIVNGLTIATGRTSMSHTFSSVRIGSISGLNTINVSDITNFSYCFYNCQSITSLDLSTWNSTNATDVSYMFQNCTSLATLDLSSFDFSHVTSSSNRTYMFSGIPANCTIYVKNAATQSLLAAWDSTHTYSLKS